MDKPLNIVVPEVGMDVFAQEDAVESFLAEDSKEFNDDLLLSHVDNDNEAIQFKSENVLDCGDLDVNVLEVCDDISNGNDIVKDEKSIADFKRFRRNALVSALKKRSIKW